MFNRPVAVPAHTVVLGSHSPDAAQTAGPSPDSYMADMRRAIEARVEHMHEAANRIEGFCTLLYGPQPEAPDVAPSHNATRFGGALGSVESALHQLSLAADHLQRAVDRLTTRDLL